MQFERTKNSTRTLSFGLINRIVITILPFITRTIILHKLGNEYAGLSSLFTSVLSILNLSELGIDSAITFCLYKPVAEDNRAEICALLNFLKKAFRYIGLTILLLGLAVMPFLQHLIKGDYPADINIYLLYLIYLVNASVSYLSFAYKKTLFAVYQRGDMTHKIQTVVEIGKYLVQIIVLLLFANYYWFALLLPIASFVTNLVTEHYSKKMFPELNPAGKISKERKRVIKNKVIFLAAHTATSRLSGSIAAVVISGAIGLSATAIYGNYEYIYSAILGIALVAYNAVRAPIGNSLYTKTEEENEQLFHALWFACTWGVVWCTTCLLCLYQPFMILWVGEENLLDFLTVVLFCLLFFTNGMQQFLTSTYLGVAGMWDKTLLRQILAAAANVGLSILLAPRYGVLGVVLSALIAHAVIGLPLDIRVLYKYVFKKNVSEGMRRIIQSTGLLVLCCLITYGICGLVTTSGLLGLVIKLGICIVLPNAVIILLNFRKAESRFLWEHLRIFVKRNG